MFYSIVIPVYNRPLELKELLDSLCELTYNNFEVVIVEDGSQIPSDSVVGQYSSLLKIKYITQENTGPGLARNNGAINSCGEYIIFLDSDTIVPVNYLHIVNQYIADTKALLWGGPDKAMDNFTDLQKAINYSMTSIFTTGGIRGKRSKGLDKFFPRSFNMGISREVFDKAGGFSSLRFGEDIDFCYRVTSMGIKAMLFNDAFVYHKRRNTRNSFYRQVFFSGMARVNISLRHKGSLKLVHTFPSLFVICSVLSILLLLPIPIFLVALVWFVDSLRWYNNITISIMAVETSFIQMFGYGLGFLYGVWNRVLLKKEEDVTYRTKFF